MKKALIIATVSGFLPQFEMNNVKLLKMKGYEIHYASNYNNPVYGESNKKLEKIDIVKHQVDFYRSPFSIIKHIKAYKQLKRIMVEHKFDIVHCHTPVGGIIGRFAAKKTGVDYVVYTAHGFHFYKGAPLLNWILFYPIERIFAHFTDTLITINQEDFNRAKKFHLRRRGNIKYIPGVGIESNLNEIEINKEKKCLELGIASNTMIFTSVGELSARKNHVSVIQAISQMKEAKIQYIICGSGREEQKLLGLVKKLGLEDRVFFLGYRQDVKEILSITDVFIFPSKQEGLPVALMEAMVTGLPVICSNIRGNADLIQNEMGGYLVKSDDIDGYVNAIQRMMNNTEEDMNRMAKHNRLKIKEFDIEIVEKHMENVYDFK